MTIEREKYEAESKEKAETLFKYFKAIYNNAELNKDDNEKTLIYRLGIIRSQAGHGINLTKPKPIYDDGRIIKPEE